MKKNAIPLVFEALLRAIRDIPGKDIDLIAEGLADVKIIITRKGIDRKSAAYSKDEQGGLEFIKSSVSGSVDVHVKNLDSFLSREESEKYLSDPDISKTDLIALAHYYSIRVTNKDSIKKIIEILIDTTVGYRLRSQAIRGEPNLAKD